MAKLILLRHGESEWNKLNLFTGWEDVSLTDQGKIEAKLAAFAIQNLKVDINHAFTSALKRAKNTLEIVLYILKKDIEIISDKALNERNYGDLTGLNKDEARKKWGDEQVKIWRRSYDVAPENGESLKDVSLRVEPFLDELPSSGNILVVSHGNTIRAISVLFGVNSKDNVKSFEIKVGTVFKV